MQAKDENKLLKGSLWASGARWCIKIIGLISTLIIVRIIIPEDFGIIMKAILVSGPITIAAQIGFFETLLKIKKPEKYDYDTAFTLNIIFGGTLALLLFVSAPLWAKLLYQPEITYVLQILSIKPLFAGFFSPRYREFQRDFNYSSDFLLQVLSKIISVTAIILATLYYKNYLGPIVGQTLGACCYTFISYIFLPYRPALCLKSKAFFLSFSLPNIRAGLADYVLQNLDRMLLARYISTSILGLYNIAYELAEQFTTEIIYPLARSFFPVFAELENDKEALRKTYLSSMTFLIPLCIAIGFGLSLVAEKFILVYAGENWRESAIFLKLLSLSAAAQAFCLVNGSVLGAIGHMKKRAHLTVSHAILSAVFMLPFALNADIMAVLYVKICFGLLFVILNLYVTTYVMQIATKELLLILIRPVLASIVMVITVTHLPDYTAFFDLISHTLIGATSFIVSTMIIWYLMKQPEGAEKKLYSYCAKFLNNTKSPK
ncbi:MAG: oligosaccharide flippase family protein [Pseudomonadota bacterium]